MRLILETGGGANVYGHDEGACFSVPGRTIAVTPENYREYLACVAADGKRNGIGPDQLTHWSLQQEADREGGCHLPRPNVRVGSRHFARLLRDRRARTVWDAFAMYRTGQPYVPDQPGKASEYVEKAQALLPGWRRLIEQAGTTPTLT